MNLHRPLRTDRRLWQVCAGVAFVLLGFVDIGPEGKIAHTHLWGWVGRAIWIAAHPEGWLILPYIAIYLAIQAAILAIPAAAFGWVAQAVIVVIRDWRRQHAETDERQPN
ncbi:MAG: hypothetical protein ABGY75_06940 [Gemmataceae bacterium]